MKIIHCADLHLDSPMRTHLDAAKSKERKLELLETFRRMVAYAQEQEVSAILIAGDLFDCRNVSKPALNAFLKQVETHPDITFYYLRGNHDATSLPLAEGLPENLKLFSDSWTRYVLNEDGAKQQIVLHGVEFNGSNENTIYDGLNLQVRDFNIVMLHGQTTAHNMGDRTEYIQTKKLADRGIDYLALGHVHSHVSEKIDSRGTYYFPGCLEGRGFDECGEHGFILLNVNEDAPGYTTEFVPFAQRRLYTVETDVSTCMTSEEMRERVEQTLGGCNYPESSLIKIVLKGNIDVACEKDLSYILHPFTGRYYFVKIEDDTRMQVDFRMYAFDESLKGEFIRTVLGSDLSDEEKGEIIHYGLMALRGDLS